MGASESSSIAISLLLDSFLWEIVNMLLRQYVDDLTHLCHYPFSIIKGIL